jgi:glycosyltransferase involved in cell wall biosynthesis
MNPLIVDLTKIDNLYCGLGQYALHYSQALIDHYPEASFYLSRRGLVNLPAQLSDRAMIESIFNKRLGLGFPQSKIWHALHQDVRVYPEDSKRKRVLTIHDLNFLSETTCEEEKKSYLKRLQRKIDLATAVVCISQFTLDQCHHYLNLSNAQTKVILNGACINAPAFMRRPPLLPQEVDSFYFSIGAITPKKNFHKLIDLALEFPQETFVLAGDDSHPYAREMKQQIQERKLERRVFLVGIIDDEQKHFLFTHSKALIHPSLLEGFGLPLVEAMSYGLPVLCSQVCSMPEVAGPTGYFFDPQNSDSLKQAVTSFERDKRESKIVHESLILRGKSFNWTRAAREYTELFNQLT